MESISTQQGVLSYVPPDLVLDATHPSYPVDHQPEGEIGYVSAMGLSNLYSLPVAIIGVFKNWIRAIRNFDIEAAVESLVRMLNIPIGLLSVLEKVALIFWMAFKGVSIVFLTLTSQIAGGIFLFIEGLLEFSRFYRILKFERELGLETTLSLVKMAKDRDIQGLCLHRRDLETRLQGEYVERQFRQLLGDAPENKIRASENLALSLVRQKLSHLRNRYFTIEGCGEETENKLKGRMDSFARKVRPWLVEEVRQKITPIISGIEHDADEKCFDAGVELLQKINMQVSKTRKVYILGLITIAVAVLAFSAACFFPPSLLILALVLGGAASILETMRLSAIPTYLDQKDEKIHLDPLIPNFLKRKAPPQKEIDRQPMIELATLKA